tara:strand:+ start:812 stop:2065 length:1254 start_codon:yes stop_codon:yes gene_type:complete
MAKTTTINTKTGERLKGVKATEKGINGLANFGRDSDFNMNAISRASRAINEFVNRRSFFEFSYYKDPKLIRSKDIDEKSIMGWWWKYDVRYLTGERNPQTGQNVFKFIGNKTTINGSTVYTDRAYRFVRDVVKPQFHLAFFTPNDFDHVLQESSDLAKGLLRDIFTEEQIKEINRFEQQFGDGSSLSDTKMTKGPYQNYYAQQIKINAYFTVNQAFFEKPFGATYEGAIYNKKSGISEIIHKAYTLSYPNRSTEDRVIYYRTDVQFGRHRVYHPFPIQSSKLSNAKMSQSYNLIDPKRQKGSRPQLWSTDTSNYSSGKFSGLTKQEIDVELITAQFYKLFVKWYGIYLVKQIQAPPMDDGLYISRIRTGTQLKELTETRNYLYALSQLIVRGRYYYNPATDEPDLSYQSVEVIAMIN